MKQASKKSRSGRIRRLSALLALVAAVAALSGCRTLNFYGQAIKGHYELLAHAQPIQKLLANPQTPGPLKERLRLLLELRVFAEQKLKLPVDGHYQRYVDAHRPFVVWNVEAAPEFSLQPKAWWYPLVGSLEYRGYFSERAAGNYGRWLERNGYDVYLGGAQAYSTLGWFKDPVLNTFIFEPDADLAEVIFHELGHQRVFARGDTDFNEAFATTVGQEGARRWLRAQGVTAKYEVYRAQLRRTAQFARLIMETRAQLATLYGDERNEWGRLKATNKKRDVPRQELRLDKERILDQLKRAYVRLEGTVGRRHRIRRLVFTPHQQCQAQLGRRLLRLGPRLPTTARGQRRRSGEVLPSRRAPVQNAQKTTPPLPAAPGASIPHSQLAYRNQGHFFAFGIAGDAMSARVKGGVAIDEKAVMVMAVMQGDLEEPGAIRLPLHPVGCRVPVVEIADQTDLLGAGGQTNKIDGLGHPFGGITVAREKGP